MSGRKAVEAAVPAACAAVSAASAYMASCDASVAPSPAQQPRSPGSQQNGSWLVWTAASTVSAGGSASGQSTLSLHPWDSRTSRDNSSSSQQQHQQQPARKQEPEAAGGAAERSGPSAVDGYSGVQGSLDMCLQIAEREVRGCRGAGT
eukprot:TRINITY_DN9050_c0_g1_i1.p2 TRINITY_DN9050_c0_g1~~TRINITY_DN9050_c0_g1_i1.p2  ORF type:complete len:148 (+),score=22.40 TRINITY_DN9050_c0_g1_i1:137-580(+)